VSNVLSEEKKQQVIALGRLGWSLRRIEQATGVRGGKTGHRGGHRLCGRKATYARSGTAA
jgi:hypothetical protein